MSLNNKEINCALCHAYLFPEDDIVYCPVCGAPHHRECYNSLDRCALEEFHGTENQYDKLQAKKQTEQKPPEEEKTQTNPQTQFPPFGQFANIDFLGGVPADYKLGQNVTAKEARDFVLSNTMRYIPKFARLTPKNKISWNFLAFLFPSAWFLSRKMYKNGIIAGLLSVIATLLTIPLNNTLYNLGVLGSSSYQEIMQTLTANISEISVAVVFASFIGGILNLIIRIICGLFGDYWYKNHVVRTITEIKKESEDIRHDFQKYGGVNFFFFFVGLLAVQYIPAIIAIFI